MIKGDLTELVKDREKHKFLTEMTEDGFTHTAMDGPYYVMTNEKERRYYDPRSDMILPVIERCEEYG